MHTVTFAKTASVCILITPNTNKFDSHSLHVKMAVSYMVTTAMTIISDCLYLHITITMAMAIVFDSQCVHVKYGYPHHV